jgi:hypothetical protein
MHHDGCPFFCANCNYDEDNGLWYGQKGYCPHEERAVACYCYGTEDDEEA